MNCKLSVTTDRQDTEKEREALVAASHSPFAIAICRSCAPERAFRWRVGFPVVAVVPRGLGPSARELLAASERLLVWHGVRFVAPRARVLWASLLGGDIPDVVLPEPALDVVRLWRAGGLQDGREPLYCSDSPVPGNWDAHPLLVPVGWVAPDVAPDSVAAEPDCVKRRWAERQYSVSAEPRLQAPVGILPGADWVRLVGSRAGRRQCLVPPREHAAALLCVLVGPASEARRVFAAGP